MTEPIEAAVPILRVTDSARALAWYERLGFRATWQHRFSPELPAFTEIDRSGVRLFLSEHEEDARPDTLVYLQLREVEALAAELDTASELTEWGTLEFEVRDPDGNRLRIGTPVDEV
ncbi:glyoxalase superfamily protein [Streptomyces sp. XM4193]|uniref:glyoxalase superfamily protein n=1 Tax=Streptomyces sp. XM4193 TaxID=2929782 RepID=UPI001FFC0BA3|nr:glyoxalase superfamily protein [Streptomyces sp. XM4193]MCK1799077.1 glyoxalase superfamily protein [Streptomyces sp. XM4193]